MNAKRISIMAIVAVALAGLSTSAMAEQKPDPDPDPEQELFNDCFEKAKNTGQFSDGEANLMCINMVAETYGDDEDRAKPLQGFKLKKKRTTRITTKRRRIRMKTSRY